MANCSIYYLVNEYSNKIVDTFQSEDAAKTAKGLMEKRYRHCRYQILHCDKVIF